MPLETEYCNVPNATAAPCILGNGLIVISMCDLVLEIVLRSTRSE